MQARQAGVTALAAVSIAALAFVALQIPGPPAPNASQAPTVRDLGVPDIQRDPTPSSFTREEVVAESGSRILRVQDIAGSPIEGAACVIVEKSERIATRAPLAVSGGDGVLHVPAGVELSDSEVLGVGADGYAPKYLTVVESGTVILAPHESVVGSASDAAGRPVRGVTIALSRCNFGGMVEEALADDSYRISGIGEAAVFRAQTEEDGTFRVRGVPRGRYSIAIAHESQCVVDAGTEGGRQFMDVPGRQLSILMAPVHVAAVDIRGGELATAALRHPKWSATSALTRLALRRFMQENQLGDSWSGDRLRYYLVPDLRAQPEDLAVAMELFPLTADPVSVDVPVTPVDFDGPVKVVEIESRWEPAVATISVTDAGGQKLGGVRISMTRLDEDGPGAVFAAEDGQSIELPRGKYRVAPTSPLLKRTLGSRRPRMMEIDGGEVTVSFCVPIPCRRVIMTSDEVERFGGKVYLRGDQPGLWWNHAVPAGSTPEFWLPIGPYLAKVKSFGFETVEFGMSVTAGDGPQEVQVPPLAWSSR